MDGTIRPGRWILVATLGAALATGLLATEASAGKADRMSATANGHHVKFRPGQICDGFTMRGVSVVAAQKPHHLGQLVRGVAVACAVDLTTSSFPLTSQFCTLGYTELKVAKAPLYRQFGGSVPSVQVTFTSFDGTRVEGTFSGTLQPESGATTSATLTNGKFSLLLGGDACTNPAQAE